MKTLWKTKLAWPLLLLVLAFILCLPGLAQADDVIWQPEDFTYEEDYSVSLKTHANAGTVNLTGTVISGFSASGLTKLGESKDLVIPEVTPDGTAILGVGKNAFREQGLESVTLPQGTSNFLIESGAFYKNTLTEITIPSGVIRIGEQAFFQNSLTKVSISETVFQINNQSFARNQIEQLILPESSVIPLQLDNFSFAFNQIKEITLPDNIEKVSGEVFVNNTGREPSPSTVYSCGIVWMYTSSEAAFSNDKVHCYTKLNSSVHSDYQKLVLVDADTSNKWLAEDFTYDGATITGLSASGLAKRPNIPALVLPDKNPDTGEDITAIAAATAGNAGLFGYIPSSAEKDLGAVDEVFTSVILPAKLQSIGNFAFQNNQLSQISFPDTLETIGMAAFQTNNLVAVNLPDSLTSLGNGAFASNATLASVTLSKNLVDIPASAFLNNSQNTNFSSLVIPAGVKTIGANAFGGAGLTSLTIPNTVISIGNNAFNLHLLTSLSIPGSVKTIGSTAFGQCINCVPTLTTLKLGEGIETIGANAFRNGALTEVNIPASLTKLEINAFANNIGYQNSGVVNLYTPNAAHLTDTTNFPTSTHHTLLQRDVWLAEDFTYDGATITGLSASGIAKRPNLPELVLPDKNPITGEDITALAAATAGKAGLFGHIPTSAEKDLGAVDELFTSVQLPAKLQSIGAFAFQNNQLSEVSFPDTLVSIDNAAFQTNQLQEVILPNSLTTLGSGVFATNPTLTTVKLSTSLTTIPTSTFNGSAITAVVIPAGVTTIGGRAFAGAPITSLYLPDSVTTIETYAFNQHKLTSLVLPPNVTSLGTYAFGQVDGEATLTSLTLNDKLTSIGNRAFQNAALTIVALPDSLTTLHANAFYGNSGYVSPASGATGKVYLTTNKEAHLAFNTATANHQVIFGWQADDFTYDGVSITGYSASGEEKRFILSDLVLPDTAPDNTIITRIADGAFAIPTAECTDDRDGVVSPYGMQSITLPANLEVIGAEALARHNFAEIDFPATLTTIGASAFANGKLVTLVLPDTVTEVGDAAFASNRITSLTLSKGLTVINDGAFSSNTGIKQLTLHEGLVTIGEYAFNGVTITSLNIPTTVTEIKRGAFHYHNIKNLHIPGNVKVIGERAFQGSIKIITLTNLTLGEGIEEIGQYAFSTGHLSTVVLPTTLKKLHADAFSSNTGFNSTGTVLLYTSNQTHVTDKANFPASTTHTIVWLNDNQTTNPGGGGGGGGSSDSSNITIPKNPTGGSVGITNDDKTVVIVPDSGYQIADVLVDGVSVGAVNSYTFTDNDPHKVEVEFKAMVPEGEAPSFNDISNHWAKDYIAAMVAKGYMNGISATNFGADAPLTRAQLVTVLWNIEGKPQVGSGSSFADLGASDSYYYQAVLWAAGKDIVLGTSATSFSPSQSITREQLAVIIYRYALAQGIELPQTVQLTLFADVAQISDYAKEAISALYCAGIIEGRSGNIIDPQGEVTRAEAAAMLCRLLELAE